MSNETEIFVRTGRNIRSFAESYAAYEQEKLDSIMKGKTQMSNDANFQIEKLENRIKDLEKKVLEKVINKDIHSRINKILIEFNSRLSHLEYKMGINPYE